MDWTALFADPDFLQMAGLVLVIATGGLGTTAVMLWRRLSETRETVDELAADKQQAEKEQALNEQRMDATQREMERVQGQLDDLSQRYEDNQQALNRSVADGRAQASRIESLDARIADYQSRLERAENALEQERREHSTLHRQHEALKSTLEERERNFKEQLALVNDSRDQLKKEFENLANEILEKKGKAFSELSEKNITGLLQPIQNEMKGFREKVETLHTQETEQRASLKTELQQLQKLNRDITDQASKLTDALRGQKKVQGNWGELMLANVLDSAGLQLGRDYVREESFRTEDGRRRPDVLVYLPQGKHLVIDAKTSLNAYTDYVNAEDDVTRQQSLSQHAAAVGDRITELADKAYYQLPGLNSPEVVIMFIPIESAYVEALKQDEKLFQRAIENNVLVATPTTLLTSLNIVRQLWQFEDRSKHSEELARRAESFHNKLRNFLESMEDVGKKLDTARGSYDKAMGQLVTGKGNLIKQADDFRSLGVSVKKELPTELVERARMELPRSSAGAETDTDNDDRSDDLFEPSDADDPADQS